MNSKTLSWLILVFLSVVWGSSFILMKLGMKSFSSSEVAALRIGIAFLVLLPFQLKYYKINLKKYLPAFLLVGFSGNLIPAFLFTFAETQVSSSLAGMLNALTPLFTIVVGFIWLKTKPNQNQIIGVTTGFIAALCLVIFDNNKSVSQNAAYSLLLILAVTLYGISNNAVKKYLHDIPSVQITVWTFSFTGPTALLYLFGYTDFTTHLSQGPQAMVSMGYICILAIVGTALAVIVYNILIKKAGIVFASSCMYLTPIVAILWGILDGESINLKQILSILAIIFSVYLINRPTK